MRNLLILLPFSFFSPAPRSRKKHARKLSTVLSLICPPGECDAALDVLGEADGGNDDAIYVQVLASAHACKADFNEIAFISDDLSSIDTSSSATILKSMAVMSLSPTSSADADEYVSMRTAINTILNTTTTIGQSSRTTKFGTRKAGDLGVQALILGVVISENF